MKNRLGKVFKVMLLTLTLVLMYSINVSAASGQASIGSSQEWSDDQIEPGYYSDKDSCIQKECDLYL